MKSDLGISIRDLYRLSIKENFCHNQKEPALAGQ
jgi:hypothetical protein